jgi:fructokinase
MYALERALEDLIDFANAADAVSITRRGGVASMPTLAEVEACRKNTRKLIVYPVV